jgi:hypothetical protein
MKMNLMRKYITACCFVATMPLLSQEELNCETNFKNALFYLKGTDFIEKDSLKAIEFLKPCVEKGDANAQLLMGRLHVAKQDEENYEKAFEFFKESAKQGNDIAMTDLGILYKYGRGCDLDFNKARKWFKKAAELGNDKASYSLGYLYLKGFGNIEQDYTKAAEWFQKSEYVMAKYWLGVSYYYGYGVEKNIEKANELLGTNFENNISNDDTSTLNQNSTTNEALNTTSVIENTDTSVEVLETNLLGKWKGVLLKYDWSGKHIERKYEAIVQFLNDSITQLPSYKITIADQEIVGNLNLAENAIYFDDNQLKLPHVTFNENIPNELSYSLLSTDVNLKALNNKTYIIGNIDNYIPNFNESGAPLKLVIKKIETFANSDEEISDDLLEALASQEESFIKLYPNPFQSDLIISYTLENSSFVEVKINDLYGAKNAIIEKGTAQKAGKYSYFFNGNNLEKGVYVVTVLVDNNKKTKIIVKK